MKHILFGIAALVFGLGSAAAATFTAAPKVDTIADLTNRVVSTAASSTTLYVEVARFSSGHTPWAKSRIARFSPGDTRAVNHGAVEPSTLSNARWVFDDCLSGDPINLTWFGAFPNDEIDDTDAFQAAANWQTNVQGCVLTGPVGRYNIGSVIFREGMLDGRVHVREQGYGYYGFVLVQNAGATNHMLRAIADGTYRGYQFRNVTLEGRANANLRNPKSITGVTDRFNFTVSPSDLPSNGGTNTVYPYYGHVFFYTSENKYAGFGIVSNINFSTGLCTLMDNTDAYATLASDTNGYLTVGWKACFSPSVTERSDGGDITRIDPFSAGYAGISFEGQGGVNYEGGAESVNIRGFHAGIRLGPVVAHRIHHAWTKMNVFAGIGTAFSGKSYDLSMGDIQVQGFYEDSYPEVPETLVLTNNLYRYTAYGLYGIDTTGQINDVTADHDVIGAYLPWNSDTIFGQFHIEGPSLHGLWLDGSFWGGVASQGPERTHGTIGLLNIRSHSSLLNNPPMPNPPGRRRYAIYGTYQNNAGYAPRWRIDTLNVGDHTLNTVLSNRFDAVFHSDNSNVRVSLGHLDTRSGATNIYSTTTQTRFTPTALGYTEEGRYKLDVQFDEMLGGASTNQYRQDDATKQFRLLGVRYDTDSTDYGAMLGWLDDGSERYWQVGWGASTRPPPTYYQFYGSDSYGGAEELWAQWDNSIFKFYGDQFQIRSPLLFVTDTNLTLVNYSSDGTRFMHTGSQSPTETIQDIVGGMLVAGSNVNISYDDPSGQITISSTGGGGSTNGTSVYVEGTYRNPVNLADTTDIDWTYIGTNANAVLATQSGVSGTWTNPVVGVNSKGVITSITNGTLTGGSGSGTNAFVNGVLIQPFRLTNNLTSDAGRVIWYTNANGNVVAYATNLPAGGSSSNTIVLVNGTSVTNPNLTNTDANIVLSVASSTNVQINLNTNINVTQANIGTVYVSNAFGVDVGGSGRSNLTAEAYVVGNGTNSVKLVTAPTTNAIAGWIAGVASQIKLGSNTVVDASGYLQLTNVSASGGGGTNLYITTNNFVMSTNNLGYVERNATQFVIDNTDGELSPWTITIPANVLGVDGDEVTIHVPATITIYSSGGANGYSWELVSDSSVSPVNVAELSTTNRYFTTFGSDPALAADWDITIKRTATNQIFVTTKHSVGPSYTLLDSQVPATNYVETTMARSTTISGNLDVTPIDFTMNADIADDARAANITFLGYLVYKKGSLGQSNYITSVSSDFQVSGGALSLTNTTGTGRLVRESASGSGSGVTNLAQLSDVTGASPSTNSFLVGNGTKWTSTNSPTISGTLSVEGTNSATLDMGDAQATPKFATLAAPSTIQTNYQIVLPSNAIPGFVQASSLTATSLVLNPVQSTGSGNVVLSAGPTLTGDPVAPTPSANDNDTSIATTAYVQGEETALRAANYWQATNANLTTLAGASITGTNNFMRTRTGVARRLLIPASAFASEDTEPATADTNRFATATDRSRHLVWSFSPTSTNGVNLLIPAPTAWDLGSLNFQLHWKQVTAEANTTNVWAVAAGSIGDDETGGAVLGSFVTVLDQGLNDTNKIAKTSWSSSVTVGGTPSGGDSLMISVRRWPGDTSDNMTVSSRLIAVSVEYTESTTEPTDN